MTTDFHCHILPGIDDGSKDLTESLTMLHLMAKQGIDHVVATPHFYAERDSLEEFLKKRNRAEAMLRAGASKMGSVPGISVGAEVFYFRGMSESEFLPQLTIRGKRCILIEMPPPPWSGVIYRELEDIWQKRGLTPVIAHIERYIGPFRTRGVMNKLASLPVLVQANANFFLDHSTSSAAMRLLKEGHIHLLGSDCHNLTTRKPNLGPALERIEQKLGREVLEDIAGYARGVLE